MELKELEELGSIVDKQTKTGDMAKFLKPYLVFLDKCAELQVLVPY